MIPPWNVFLSCRAADSAGAVCDQDLPFELGKYLLTIIYLSPRSLWVFEQHHRQEESSVETYKDEMDPGPILVCSIMPRHSDVLDSLVAFFVWNLNILFVSQPHNRDVELDEGWDEMYLGRRKYIMVMLSTANACSRASFALLDRFNLFQGGLVRSDVSLSGKLASWESFCTWCGISPGFIITVSLTKGRSARNTTFRLSRYQEVLYCMLKGIIHPLRCHLEIDPVLASFYKKDKG